MSFETTNQIKTLLRGCSEAELREINHSIIEQLRQKERMTAMSFGIRDHVWFNDKHGYRIDGVVTKVNARSVTVDTLKANVFGSPTTWRVSANLLHHVIENGAIVRG